jgi:hypothetical protein
MVVKTEEELNQRLSEGWRLHRDEYGFVLYNPQEKKRERIDKSLYHLCEHLYSKMKQKDEATQASTEEAGAERGSARARSPDKALEEDTKLILNTIRQRLDPKAPIITKWTENIAWWNHIIIDTSTYLLPDLLAMLRSEEIDLNNPETTTRNIIAKFKALRETARNAEELEKKYSMELEALKQRLSSLEALVKQYSEIIAEQNKLIDKLAEKAKSTIAFFMVYIPKYLPEEARTTYMALAGKIKDVWGEEVE